MPKVRVYLFTYNRSNLLRRALGSLLKQSFRDWICELHNDNPNDPYPSKLVKEIADPRIVLVNHDVRLGGTRSFNLMFRPVPEEFVSLLEDDNWWNPRFLETMIANLESHPKVNVAWANMRCWTEEKDGTWRDSGLDVWNDQTCLKPKLIEWPNKRQIVGALHSNGAMLIRSRAAAKYKIPDSTFFDGTEGVRERAFDFPIIFVPEALANFAVTRESERKTHKFGSYVNQVLLLSSFIKNVPINQECFREVVNQFRRKPRAHNILIWSLIFGGAGKELKEQIRFLDFFYFAAWVVKHPNLTIINPAIK